MTHHKATLHAEHEKMQKWRPGLGRAHSSEGGRFVNWPRVGGRKNAGRS